MIEPIERLIRGFNEFREAYYVARPDFYENLVRHGQSPKVMVISCSDSRVNPSIIAKAEPGELFIVRNVANLVPPYQPDGHYHGTSAAVEFAVRDLAVEHIIVLGHSHCGGIRTLCKGHGPGQTREFIDEWMSILGDVAVGSSADETALREIERRAISVSLDNLMTFPWVRDGVLAGRLRLHGWWFDLEAGALLGLDRESGVFLPVTAA